MREALWIGLGGFLGANARYLLGGWIATHMGSAFPYGTFVINITGSFVLGLILGFVEGHMLSPTARMALTIGFLGSYTTFSTWTYETVRLIESGSIGAAALNLGASLLVGVLAAGGGLAAGRAL
jgi:CrcB protein